MKWLIILGLVALLGIDTLGQNRKDIAAQPIELSLLRQKIRTTPLASEEHHTLIYRGAASKYLPEVLEEYKSLLNKNPNRWEAYRWLGKAAMLNERRLLDLVFVGEFKTQKSYDEMHMRYFTEECFRKAIELNPNSGILLCEFGSYVYDHFSSIQKPETRENGLAMILKGVKLAPDNPRTHCLLGNIYVRKGFPHYNLALAERELKEANRLDPNYSSPYVDLVNYYIYKRDYSKSQKALNDYLSLLPESARKIDFVINRTKELQEGLAKMKQ